MWHCVCKILFCHKCHCIEPTEQNHLSVCTRTFRNDSQNSSLRLFNVVNLVQPLRLYMLELLYTDVRTRVSYREIVYTKTFLYGLCIYLSKGLCIDHKTKRQLTYAYTITQRLLTHSCQKLEDVRGKTKSGGYD